MSSIAPATEGPEAETVASNLHKFRASSLTLRETFARSIPSRARTSPDSDGRSKQRRSSRTRIDRRSVGSEKRVFRFAPDPFGQIGEHERPALPAQFVAKPFRRLGGSRPFVVRTAETAQEALYRSVDYAVQLAADHGNARKAFQRVVQRICQHREAGLAGIARADEYRQRPKLDRTLPDGAEVLDRDADIGMVRASGAPPIRSRQSRPFRASHPVPLNPPDGRKRPGHGQDDFPPAVREAGPLP